jgi:tRNA (guanine-N7-)-methyltransferase
MSTRNKLMKFAEVLSFPNVYENFNPRQPRLTASEGVYIDLKGKWASDHFKNNNPIVLELACGRGEYSLALAKENPNKNYIGVDIKGARIWKGASIALNEEIHNVAFLRTRIEQVQLFFGPQEVDEIWITFPDPFLRKSKSNRRLTSIPFLDRYHPIFKENGILHLKTDDPTLYEFSLETLDTHPAYHITYHSDDIYSGPLYTSALNYKTYYEKMHLEDGRTIKYIQATHLS